MPYFWPGLARLTANQPAIIIQSLSVLRHRDSLKRKKPWNSLQHLHGRRTVTKFRKDAHSDASIESAQLECFRHIKEWLSPETIKTYIATMNKRQAMKAVLDDERAQDQNAANA